MSNIRALVILAAIALCGACGSSNPTGGPDAGLIRPTFPEGTSFPVFETSGAQTAFAGPIAEDDPGDALCGTLPFGTWFRQGDGGQFCRSPFNAPATVLDGWTGFRASDLPSLGYFMAWGYQESATSPSSMGDVGLALVPGGFHAVCGGESSSESGGDLGETLCSDDVWSVQLLDRDPYGPLIRISHLGVALGEVRMLPLNCQGGGCATCTEGASCELAEDACSIGTSHCTGSAPSCVDTGADLSPGSRCAYDSVCNSEAVCTYCAGGQTCDPGPTSCVWGSTDCNTGEPVCVAGRSNKPAGTSCGDNATCDGFGNCQKGSGEPCNSPSECVADACNCVDAACSTHVCGESLCGCSYGPNGDCTGGPVDDGTVTPACGAPNSCVAGTCS